MPRIQEVMDEAGNSEGTSLQVSSTSPEVIQNMGRALQVRETTSHASRSSSSSSSRRALQNTPRQSSQLSVRNKTKKSQDGPTSSRSSSMHSSTHRPPRPGSHRGEGSIAPVGSNVVTPAPVGQGSVPGWSDDDMDGSPRVHFHATQQNLYDQRSMHVQVGIDPERVIQHVQPIESQAQSMVMDAASRVQQTQHKAASVVHETRMKAQSVVHETQLQAQRVYDEAQSAVHQARSHASTVEGRASEIIQELNTRHQSELAKAQDVANQLHYQAQVRSQESDAQIQKLMDVVESQSQALETQRVRNEELSAHVAALQNEVVMLRHSSVPVAPSQDI